jgi:hypothetical protein
MIVLEMADDELCDLVKQMILGTKWLDADRFILRLFEANFA